MLQPRLSYSVTSERKMRGGNFFRMDWWSTICFAVIFSATIVSCQDVQIETNPDSIEATRIKREGVQENRDLTVLLVNDQKRADKVGRYHSVKPVIGLLTATARTFIQDGVTTEFATQILGTTLDNGRIYAQLLTKSSLVLYNKPTNVEDPSLVKPTRVHNAFDGQWNVKQDLGFIDPEKFVLKNTDYISPSSKMEIVYAASKDEDRLKYWSPPTSPESYSENQILDEPTGRRVQPVNEIPHYEAFNMLDGPNEERKIVVKPNILEDINSLHRQNKAYDTKPEPVKLESRHEEKINETNVVKVKPDNELPTFTIKNEFSPIFYYIDNVETRSPVHQASQPTKLPKKLFGQKGEPKPKKTYTYAGFADFTTVVGDTVIVFSPNTDTPQKERPGEVNVYPSAKPVDKLATKITFLAADIPFAASTYKAHEAKEATRLPSPKPEDNRSEKALYNDEESLKKVLYDVDDKVPDAINVQYNNGFDLNLDVIQPSEIGITTTESTKFTEDFEVIPINGVNNKATDPLVTLRPSATVIDGSPESAVTESDNLDMFTSSEEESDNTAAEVTDADEEVTTPSGDTISKDTSGKDETYGDLEPTTETNEEKEVICTDGLETKSVMTTAYKTLTYVTTYFIPLEGTELTTSLKSDVVVESDVGYLTNIACRTVLDIEPTKVISVDVKSSIHSSLEQPDTKDQVTTPKPDSKEIVTESQTEKESPQEEIEQKITTVTDSTTTDSIETELPSPTTEQITTKERVEVSVSNEQTTTTTEKSTTVSDKSSEDEDTTENEVDVIYKTLYTTYTYFTTFFGDSTSSVASHKSVVTNVITQTINLAQIDPSLLGAFNEDEIRPTNVGIGRPTEAINSIIEIVKNKDVIEKVEDADNYSSRTPTPTLDDVDVLSIKPDAVKTYFTTYTFFTTIYVGTDANVCSRSEVYTNYVGPDELLPTKTNPLGNENSRAQFDFRNCKQVKKSKEMEESKSDSSVETSVRIAEGEQKYENKNDSKPVTEPSPVEVDMLFSVLEKPVELENSLVTDVKSSSSKGESKFLENNNILEDQISSESNIEEIMPSPTLLLQTSYTTFTYYTTMYIGKDSSKIKSRLETITNVVTETIMPKKEVEVEETNLPITYYTTFTYWTTLYKDKQTTITSREEIVSNVVTPVVQAPVTISPIDTTPIDIDSVLPPKELEIELKASALDNLEPEDGKATFYTTYTYFTTFYVGNTSQIRSSLETVTNIVDNTKVLDDNQLGRKVPSGDKNLIQDGEKIGNRIAPTVVKQEIEPTKQPDMASASPTVLVGTYIDNLFAEVKPPAGEKIGEQPEKKILFSQVAVISGASTIVTNDNKTVKSDKAINGTTSPTTDKTSVSPAADVIQGSEPEIDSSTQENKGESEEDNAEEEGDEDNPRKKSRLTFTTKKPSFTPVIRPFASRNRPTFSPKRTPPGSATVITRSDFTPTITATPSLKSVRPSGFGGNRKPQSAFPSGGGGPSSRRFTGRNTLKTNLVANNPTPASPGFARGGSITPTARRTGFRAGSARNNNADISARTALPKIRPTASIRLRGGRQSATVDPLPVEEQNEKDTPATQQEENATEPIDEITEPPVKSTSNPLSRFRRPPLRQPGSAVTPRSTTQATTRKLASTRGRLTTTTKRPPARTTANPVLSLRRQRPSNSLFPRRNLFRQPEPEPEEEIKENEQNVDDQSQEILEGEGEDIDNDYESSDRKEQQVATPATQAPKKSPNTVQIRPFAFRRRTKRQADYGNRKYSNFRRPAIRTTGARKIDEEPETEAPTTQRLTPRPSNRFSSRTNTRTTTVPSLAKSSARQPFIVRGDSRSTTATPAYRGRRPSVRTTTSSSRPKSPRLQTYGSQSTSRSNSRSNTGRSRTRVSTRGNTSRQRNSYENISGERLSHNHLTNDGKITITHHIPVEATIPIVNGKITEYKNILTAKPKIETLFLNQIATTIGPLGNQQLYLASELTKLADNGATEIVRFLLQETPTTAIIFTPTTIRGRKTSFSHVVPSTVYNVEPVTQTISPDINANVPLANLLLSQLLLGNQQPAINPLLALQGQGLLPQPQLPIVQTPVTELKTRTTMYVTTVTDNRETVLPITFRGTKIFTTINDPTVNVITATELITETVVTTPTQWPQAQAQPQFNSLLLPLLLQQQQQQQAALQTANPLLGLGMPDLNLVQSNNLLNNDIYSNSPKPNVLSDFNSNEDYVYDQESNEDSPPPPSPPKPKNPPRPAKPSPPKHTSVVTLYVSGRMPGEFSTVLSTVVSDDTQNVRKREAIYYENVKVLPSVLPNVDDLYSSQFDFILENSVISDTDKLLENRKDVSQIETESLESIVGELTKHIRYDASPTYVVKLAGPSKRAELEQSVMDEVS